jgi:hypothetical protein
MVIWWPALDHVADIYLFAREPGVLEFEIKKLACSPREDPPCPSFVSPGRFPEEHDASGGVS